MTIFVFSILLIFLLSNVFKVTFNLSNGLVVFYLTWLLSILIYLSGVFSNYPSISINTWVYMMSTFCVTTILYFFGKRIDWKVPKQYYDTDKVLKCANFILIAVLISFAITILKLGIPPTLGGSIIRSRYYVSGFETVYLMIYVDIFLYMFILKKTESIKHIVPQMMLILILILLKGNKFAFFVLLLTVLFFFGEKIKLGKVLGLSVLVIGVFIIASMLYLSSDNQFVLRNAQMAELGYQLPYSLSFLIDPMVYFSSNVVNLNSIVNANFSDWNFGAFSFKIIWQNFSFLFPESENHVQNTVIWINSNLPFPWLNTYSALGSTFVDFGKFISVMLFGLLGFISGSLDKVRSKNPSLIVLFFGLLLYQFFSLSFFTFFFTNKEIITNVLVIVFVHFYCRTAKKGAL